MFIHIKLKTLIHATSNIFYYFYYQNEKGTSKKIILGLYDPYTIINQKGTSKKVIPGLYDPLYYDKPKRNK